MNDNSLNKTGPQGNKKPTFLSSENPDVLKNFDIAITPFQQKPNSVSYLSFDAEPKKQDTPNQLQQSFESQTPNKNKENLTSRSIEDQLFSAEQTYKQNPQRANPFLYGQSNEVNRISSSTTEPVKSEIRYVFKEKKGLGFLGNIILQALKCFGCFLFFITLLIGLFAYMINF